MGDKKEASYEESRPGIGGLGRRFCVRGRKEACYEESRPEN